MYLLINCVEIAEPLARQMLTRRLTKIQPQWHNTTAYIEKCNTKFNKTGLIEIDFSKVNELLRQDLNLYTLKIKTKYKKTYRKLVNWLSENLHQFDSAYIDQLMLESNSNSLVKTTGPMLSDSTQFIRSAAGIDLSKPMLLRNILNNEKIIGEKIKNHYPFWFIDSGYTNFLTSGQKPWHRLVSNHIHHNISDRPYPADRLGNLSCFPRPWRSNGSAILVVENSEYHYKMFGTTLKQWKTDIAAQLSQYTDRSVQFRAKPMNKKTRDSLYELLKQSDYYCVITDASTAAIEAIWAGIPIITLGQHITTPVAKTSIQDINTLYRGPIGDWLCALTYHQFTAKEFSNGTAVGLMKEYYHD
jgi:hypothetical protein